MKEIISKQNPFVKELKTYHKKKIRESQQKYLLEGFHLIEEAHKSGQAIEAIMVNQRGLNEWSTWLNEFPEEQVYFVSDSVLASLSDLPTPQGMLALVAMQSNSVQDFSGKWLLLDQVQDPGNVGTMIRTADAAGFAGVIVGEGSADIYSTKVLRSMQGSNFHLPILQGNLFETLNNFQSAQIPVFGTELNEAAVSLTDVQPLENFALVMGNEGQGVQSEILKITDRNLYIPIYGQAESLNVAVAAGILMYALAVKK